jgi:molybdopterin converting factor subunit 1
MKARVRLFARLRELAGVAEAEVEIGEGLTAADLFALLQQLYPGLQRYQAPLAYAINARYVPPEHPVREGDEVALIPPVSGGGGCTSW